jgi:hypothetical protein
VIVKPGPFWRVENGGPGGLIVLLTILLALLIVTLASLGVYWVITQ